MGFFHIEVDAGLSGRLVEVVSVPSTIARSLATYDVVLDPRDDPDAITNMASFVIDAKAFRAWSTSGRVGACFGINALSS